MIGSHAARCAGLLRAGSLENIGWWNVTTVHLFGLLASRPSSHWAWMLRKSARLADGTAPVLEFIEMNRTPW